MKHQALTLAVTLAYLTSPLCMVHVDAQEPTFTALRTMPVQPVKQQPPLTDVALAANGTLTGQILSSSGQPVDGAQVSISQNAKLISKVMTTKNGQFTATGLKSGLYQIECANQTEFVRVWSPEIAPNTAKTAVVIVQDKTTMRSQFGYVDPVNATGIILGITGVTLAAITLSKIDDLDAKVSRPKSP